MLEQESQQQLYAPFPQFRLLSRPEALKELSLPCGRFRSPLTLEQKTRLLIIERLQSTDIPEGNTFLSSTGIPLNWQFLLNYLHEMNIITTPRVLFSERPNDLPKSYALSIAAQETAPHSDGTERNCKGFSQSASLEEALSKVIGEMLERYLLTLYRNKDMVVASAENLVSVGKQALDISLMNKFLPWQRARAPRFSRDKDSQFQWIIGEKIGSGKAYIPAQLVFWNYDLYTNKDEPILCQPTTNASAGHFTREEAILSGLLEHIQRDGFLIYWLNSLSPKLIDISDSDPEVAALVAYFKRYGLRTYFLNTTTDIQVPSITCVLVDERSKEPIISLGAGTGFSVKDLFIQSAYEAEIVFESIRRDPAYILKSEYVPFSERDIGRTERLRLWRGKEMLDKFSFFISGEKQSFSDFLSQIPALGTPPEQLRYVLESLEKMGAGYEVYVYDVKHKVLKTLGYHIVKIIVPQLVPLYLNEHMATLDSKRLSEVPQKLGYKTPTGINPLPHPFP